MLYIVSTPIGNIKDITLRAIDVLKSADYILAEDTRHSKPLLNHYGISTPLKSYHMFNEKERINEVLTDLRNGKEICLISDAGTPGINDPGEILVSACVENTIPVTALPGASAFLHALVCSGLSTTPFQFLGFLPKKPGELKKQLLEALTYKGTTIVYDSPKRLLKSLKVLSTLAPTRKVVIGRELTKRFEEFIRGTTENVLKELSNREIKGEIVLIISGDDLLHLDECDTKEQLTFLQEKYNLNRKEALEFLAKWSGTSKRILYNENLNT